MYRVPRPVLWWSPNEEGTDIVSAAPVNKWVWLHGRNVRQHTQFSIRRRNLLSRIPWLDRRLFGTYVASIPTIDLGDGAIRSEFRWQATHVAYEASAATYYFVDGNGGVSGELIVSNTPNARWMSVRHGGAVVNPKLDVSLSANASDRKSVRAELFSAERDYQLTFDTEIIAPRDPVVEIEVLHPQMSRDVLHELASDILRNELRNFPYGNGVRYRTAALNHIDSFLGNRNIQFEEESESRLITTPDEPARFSLTLSGSGSVRMLFAVQVHDRTARTSSVSELMPIIVSERR